MNLIKYILFGGVLLPIISFAQVVKGKIEDQHHEPLIGATVREIGTQNGVISDYNGHFKLKMKNKSSRIIVSYTGFVTDTLKAKYGSEFHIDLKPLTTELGEVTVKGNATFKDRVNSKHVEVITAKELQKAACCNLSESFQINASVDVSFSDAVTGAKTIRMLGLDGRYVQIMRENIPNIRGLLSVNGLSYIPGTWVQSIDVGKGAGSVVNGYESMVGQINVELKKPESSEKLFFNVYGNSFGRVELNVNSAIKLNDKLHTGVLLHSNYFGNEIDRNNDSFMDLPKSRQVNFMNRYKYTGKRLRAQLGITALLDEKAGGQLGFGFNDNTLTAPLYGFSNNTARAEIFGKIGVLFPTKPYKSVGFIYSGSLLDIKSGYGKLAYSGKQNTAYGNLIYQTIIGTTTHNIRTGASILYDNYDEKLGDTTLTRSEIVPGAFLEYTFRPNEDFTLLLGGRSDFHNLYGTMFMPRIHMRYEVSHHLIFRAVLGRGYRTANIIMENNKFLVSSKKLIIREKPQPEVAWNMGVSADVDFHIADKELTVGLDYFYTSFKNQLIYDRDQNFYQINVYNLKGKSFANSFQVETKYDFSEKFSTKLAYKYYDVKATFEDKLNSVPLIPKHRFFANFGYATKYDKWKADATIQWVGSQRLPENKGLTTITTDKKTPAYLTFDAQITRGFKWGAVYLGGENLLDYRQKNPILSANNPFGKEFDASMVWAPIAGRMVYVGMRWKLD